MARYILSDEFAAISESAGTLVNISNVPAEVSESTAHGTGIILFPRQHFGFSKMLVAVLPQIQAAVQATAILQLMMSATFLAKECFRTATLPTL